MKFLILLALFSFNTDSSELCERRDEDIRLILQSEDSRIGFKNGGGLFNGGVCWWHSRLQRASLYLVTFAPERPRPNSSEVDRILNHLMRMDTTVEIPGFSNFKSFTIAYRSKVQSLLERWQRIDGFLNQQWIRGLSGQSSLPSNEMKKRVDDVYYLFKNSPQPIWLMAQIKGIESHSFLLLDMLKISDGYELDLVDSNKPLITKRVTFRHGDTFLKHPKDKYGFIPYVGFQKDFSRLREALKEACGERNGLNENRGEIIPGEIEL